MDAVTEIIQCAIPVARVELLDEVTIKSVNKYSKTALRTVPTLFIEFHGTTYGVEEQVCVFRFVYYCCRIQLQVP